MICTSLQDDWQLTAGYLFQLLLFTVAAKLCSWCRCPGGQRPGFGQHLLSPWLVPLSDAETKRRLAPLLRRALLLFSLLAVVYLMVPPRLSGIPWWLQGYLAILPFWLLIETIGAILLIYGRLSGLPVRNICQNPWASRTVAEFWGRRWNRLLGDWLTLTIFAPLARRPRLALATTFIISGLIHEFLVAIPYHLLCGHAIYGLMTGYFFLQFLAVLAERQLRPFPRLARLITWLVILLPCPLILNPATLGVFRLTVLP